MYKIGDRIFYPMHGAGMIENIEPKMIAGQMREYYIVKLLCGNISVMVPTDSVKISLRNIIDTKQAEKILAYFKDCKIDRNAPWGKRYKENLERLKSGDPLEAVEVIKSLMIREKEAGLSTGDRQILVLSKNILCSELSIALGREISDLQRHLQEIIDDEVMGVEQK
ncbi:MAG: CarD family transcriptional regulator [Clostridia bacterium]|nr:CarD family transcriptional regulator [Clostridia bacterium]